MTDAPLLADFSRYPFLTADLPPVRGVIRQQDTDFQVEEVPAAPPSGTGEHLLLHLEKVGWNTRALVTWLREQLALGEDEIGWAGLKDRHAITRQWLSVPFTREAAVAALAWPEGVRLLETARHGQKLQEGYLAGNRFRILLRQPTGSADQVRETLDALARAGVPNYYGPQRFGREGTNPARGLALIRQGRGRSKRWLDKLLINSLQSLLFNDWLALRMARGLYDTVLSGDIAHKYATGGKFQVGDAATEAPRAAAFEIGATGALFGRKYHEAQGEARAIEDEVLTARGLAREDFVGSPGSRRPIRWPLADATVEEAPDGLWISFYLPRGAYATAVLREIMKADPDLPDE